MLVETLQQIPEAPTTLAALQWVIIVVLGYAIKKLYDSLERERKASQEFRYKTIMELVNTVTDVAESLDALREQLSIHDDIVALKKLLEEKSE